MQCAIAFKQTTHQNNCEVCHVVATAGNIRDIIVDRNRVKMTSSLRPISRGGSRREIPVNTLESRLLPNVGRQKLFIVARVFLRAADIKSCF